MTTEKLLSVFLRAAFIGCLIALSKQQDMKTND
jgi:hypothetical protein